MIRAEDLTVEAFREWLDSKPYPISTVGEVCHSSRCPVAEWISDLTGGHSVSVTGDWIVIQPTDPDTSDVYEIDAPWWIAMFIVEVDSHLNGKVTVAQARDALALVLA